MTTQFSINLTVHNKGFLLQEVLDKIYKNTTGTYELVVCLDGCTDNSEQILFSELNKFSKKRIKTNVIYADNVFETKANNLTAKKSTGDYIIFVQDDMLINEYAWNLRMLEPFEAFDDIFAITARCAHNWKPNLNATGNTTGWSDLLIHCSHADRNNTSRNSVFIRDSSNRGPLMLKHEDFISLNYLDEIYAPLSFDEHDLMFRAKRDLGKVCGFYDIGWESKPEYGGTRDENGNTKEWVYAADRKNAKIFYERHGINFLMTHENRIINGKNS